MLIAREREKHEESARRARDLGMQAALAAARLTALYPAIQRIWLHGSAVTGRAHARSDIDLLVEGLPRELRFDALDAANELPGARVDLARLEDAPPTLVARVLTGGRLLHDSR